ATEGEHRLDGQAQAGLELATRATGPEVGDLRLLVHLGPDAVADELADDTEVRLCGDGLDGGRDVLDMVAGHGGGDAGHHRAAGQVDELGDLRRRVADVEGPRAVTVPAVEDRAGVDRHDLACTDRPLARDAVDDLVVDRDADAGRERPTRVDPRIALE